MDKKGFTAGWWMAEQGDTKSSVRGDIAAEGWCGERRREMVQRWRGEGGVFPPRWGKLKEKLASCSRRMYCRHKPAQREGGRRERMVMEVWGAALLSWCYLTSPVKLRSLSSCFFKPQLLFACLCVFFFPTPLHFIIPVRWPVCLLHIHHHLQPCRTLRTWRSSPASWSGSSGARWVSSGWFTVLLTAAVCLSTCPDSRQRRAGLQGCQGMERDADKPRPLPALVYLNHICANTFHSLISHSIVLHHTTIYTNLVWYCNIIWGINRSSCVLLFELPLVRPTPILFHSILFYF